MSDMKGTLHKLAPCKGHEGLWECCVCGAAEGELLFWCPGYKLNADARDACFDGNVVDLDTWVMFRRIRRERGGAN